MSPQIINPRQNFYNLLQKNNQLKNICLNKKIINKTLNCLRNNYKIKQHRKNNKIVFYKNKLAYHRLEIQLRLV